MRSAMTRMVFFSCVVIIDIVVMSNFSNSDFDGIFVQCIEFITKAGIEGERCSTIMYLKYNTDSITLLG